MRPTLTLPRQRFQLFSKFQQVYDKQVDGLGLAVFRIAFSGVLLAEVLHLFYFRHLVFDIIPFVEVAEIGSTVPLLLWQAVLVLLMLGLFTRLAALANYAFLLVIFASLKSYGYMMTPVYIGMGLLFLFLPISRRLSLDRLRQRLRYSTPSFRYEPRATVSQLAYYVPVVVGIGFVYFDSALYKLTSPLWLAGLGMWTPLSLPYETIIDSTPILNQEWLVRFLGYVTLAFELFFLLLLPFRRLRPWVLLIGVGLHLGILFTLPVPLFSLGFLSLYLLIVPANWWGRLLRPLAQPHLTLYYDAECPFDARTRLVVEHLDWRRAVHFESAQAAAGREPALQGIPAEALLTHAPSVDRRGRVYWGFDTCVQVLHATGYLRPLAWLLRLPGLARLGRAVYGFVAGHRAGEPADGYGLPAPPAPDAQVQLLRGFSRRDFKQAGAGLGLVGLTLLQGVVSYNTSFAQLLRRKSGLDTTLVGRGLARGWGVVEGPARNFLGITTHPIVLDEHFAGYTHLVAVTYTGADGAEQFLPMTRPSGLPGAYLWGPIWLKWTHLVVSKQINQPRLEKGIRNFTAFWATKNQVNLDSCRFKVKVKKIAEATGWEPDFLRQQLQGSWLDAGEVEWREQQFTAHLVDLNSL
ncbi:DCC1-like thiol-disulfide oxidoreductase family protein [uncultured Hymenobacter sp.]|uniref:DCC1-like thiol-disulfide oxidoreductase family protein n=1 Tax=uncultured Hymenobacter sp. TaxID=170016 RepID=UPI0035CAB584